MAVTSTKRRVDLSSSSFASGICIPDIHKKPWNQVFDICYSQEVDWGGDCDYIVA